MFTAPARPAHQRLHLGTLRLSDAAATDASRPRSRSSELNLLLRRASTRSRTCRIDVRRARDHRAHRPVGLRQVDAAALAQPHERPHRRRAASTGEVLLDGEDVYGARRRRGRSCASAWAWCSSGPTRSRCRSSRTSPTACASTAAPARARARRGRREEPARGRPVGRR